MRIIKHGNEYYEKNNLSIIRCRECGCEFTYEEADTIKKEVFYYEDRHQYSENKQYFWTEKYPVIAKIIVCPECSYNWILSYKKKEK